MSACAGRRNFGKPEVENLGVLLRRNKNIGGLDVAMYDVLRMSGGQGVGDLDRESENGFAVHRLTGNAMF